MTTNQSHQISEPPLPRSFDEAVRIEQTRLRRRMLDGTHRRDVEQRRAKLLGKVRASAHGDVDISANPFRVINRELAALYDRPPLLGHDSGEVGGLIGEKGATAQSGLWASMTRFQAWTIGCREYLMRPHVSDDGVIRYRPVAPDMVEATASEDAPDIPVSVTELRLRQHPLRDEWVWTRDVLDISAPDNPVYQVTEARMDGEAEADWSEHYLGGSLSGGAYPYRKSDGTPVLPYVLYHAERLGDRLWDPHEGIEVVEGTLNLTVALSFWFHVLKDASWPQRYVVNAKPVAAGLSDTDDGRRAAVVTDPAVLLALELIEENQQPMVGQWRAGCDVEMLGRAIDAYAARLAFTAGLRAGDVQRVSAGARSGYAIAMTNEGKRVAQRRFRPQFQWGDERLIALTAIMLNRATSSSYPEDGYTVIHREIPLSPQELQARREHVVEMVREGLMSKLQAYQELNPGITREQARSDLALIREGRMAAA